MASSERSLSLQAPEWFGAAANSIAFFPVMMGGYAVFYAAWWPFAWGALGVIAFVSVLIAAAFFVVRGVTQIRHAAQFTSTPTSEGQRIGKAMGVLNGVTHPIWMLGSAVLLVSGQGRWVLPLMVFVIGAHFLPMARLLDRRIDYLLGPVAMTAALVAGVLALDPRISWLVVFAVAGIGGVVSTIGYALYMARGYRKMCAEAGVRFGEMKPAG